MRVQADPEEDIGSETSFWATAQIQCGL